MRRIHFIGICGTAMATAAAMLRHQGCEVSGSDQDVYPPMSDFLAAEGIPTLSGYRPEHITAVLDLVVVGNAISRGNPELEEVLDRKIRYCSLPEVIREHFLWGARSIVIAGTHGKTTTTALTGWVLTSGGIDPSVLVGGIVRNFGEHGSSYRIGGGREFIIEGDEYDSAFFDKTAKFLKYLPDIAVINNVEFDHADIYADLAAVSLAFRRFVNLVPRRGLLILGADNEAAAALKAAAVSRVETFGLGEGVDWQAHDLESSGVLTRFRVRRGGSPFGTFETPLVGAHNVRNALAAIAVATEVGLSAEQIARGLRSFAGVKRRLEVVGVADGVTIYDDFAHHPTAVAETLAGLRARPPERPHLGGVRAAFRVVVPPDISGGLRPRVRRGRSRRRRPGVPLDAAGGGAPVGADVGSRPRRPRPVGAGGRLGRRHCHRRRPRASRRGSGGHHVERGIRWHPSEAAARTVVMLVRTVGDNETGRPYRALRRLRDRRRAGSARRSGDQRPRHPAGRRRSGRGDRRRP